MAGTSVLKLKVDDKEYNDSLKQAQQGLQHLGQALNNAGKSFTQVDKTVVDYVRSIGQMETQSKSARGRIGEMSNAFVEFSLQYKKMSEEVKNSDVGKALSESIEQLKQRTIEAKNELESLNGELNNVKIPEIKENGLFSGLGGKMSGAMQVFAGNMLTKAAGAVANLGSEIFSSVQQGVELAKQGEGIRIAFERLGRGDILDGLRQATHGTVTDLELMKAAVKFNDFKLPLDQMGTLLAFAQQKAKDTGQSIDYLVESIVTGLGRQSLMILDNLGLSATEIRERMKETGDMTSTVADIIREQMAAAGDYVETAADRATQADVELKNAMEELGRTLLPLQQEGASAFTGIETAAINALNSGVAPLIPKIIDLKNGIAELYTTVSQNTVFRGMVNWMKTGIDVTSRWIPLLNILRGLLQGNAAGSGASLGASIGKAMAGYQEVENIGEVVVTGNAPARRTGGGGSRGGRGSGPSMPKNIRWDNYADKAALSAMKGVDTGPSEIWKAITEGAKESTSSVEDLAKAFEKLNKVQGVTSGEGVKDSSEMAKSWSNAGTAISAVGSAMSQIEDPAAKVMATVAQAIATIALTYAKSLEGTVTPWDWIAGAASGLAMMVNVISAIHSSTGYAQGGVIKGNSYSGDNIGGMVDGGGFVGLNAGEVVLNAAQQRGVASALSEGGNRRIEVFGRLSGETIYLSSDRYTRRTGRGTIMTWK